MRNEIILSDAEIDAVEKAIGYKFLNKRLLSKAFTHASFVNENKDAVSNERLEFFGDRILNFLMAQELFYNETGDEGTLTVLLKERVSRYPLAESVKALNIIKYLKTAGSSRVTDFENKAVSNLYEAIIGAIYVDCNSLNLCGQFIERTLKVASEPDFISTLKEYCEKNKIEIKTVIEKNGTEFVCTINFDGKTFIGSGRRKKDAEKACAETVCSEFKLI